MAETIDRQYLTFGINGDIYGVPVARVREVLEYRRPTGLPKMPDFLKGIINIRDVGIPVIDLRVRFGFAETEKTQDTAIIVIEIENGTSQILIGAVADEVYEVIELDPAHLETPPHIGIDVDANFIKNIGKREDKFIVIVDMDKVFNNDADMNFVNGMTAEVPA